MAADDGRGKPGPLDAASRCKVEGCGKRRLGSSDLCADHLNERLRLERESRERVRETAGNWAAWATPGPTLAEVAGKAAAGAEGAAATASAAREELVTLRAEVHRRLSGEVGKIPWPPLLAGVGPGQLLKRLEGSLGKLAPDAERDTLRAIKGVLDGRAGEGGAGGSDAIIGALDAAIREPARLLLDVIGAGPKIEAATGSSTPPAPPPSQASAAPGPAAAPPARPAPDAPAPPVPEPPPEFDAGEWDDVGVETPRTAPPAAPPPPPARAPAAAPPPAPPVPPPPPAVRPAPAPAPARAPARAPAPAAAPPRATAPSAPPSPPAPPPTPPPAPAPDLKRVLELGGEALRAAAKPGGALDQAGGLARQALAAGEDALRGAAVPPQAVDLAGGMARKAMAASEAAFRGATRPGGGLDAAEDVARKAVQAGKEALRDAVRPDGPALDPLGLAALAGDMAARIAGAARDALEPRLVRYLTRGLVDPAALRRKATAASEFAQKQADALRRRLRGRYETDAYGVDRDLVELVRPLLRVLYRRYWRVETTGIEHVPATGPVLVAANRSCLLPWDAAMVATAIREEHPAPREVRLLVLDWLASVPFAAELLQKTGMLLARPENAERLLAAGELCCAFPEGDKGVGKPFRDRYRLARFGRGEFVTAARQAGAPIVPCAVVGCEEASPVLARLDPIGRVVGLPKLPVPVLPLPLPTRWYIRFGRPIEAPAPAPDLPEDPALDAQVANEVRGAVQGLIDDLVEERRGIFW